MKQYIIVVVCFASFLFSGGVQGQGKLPAVPGAAVKDTVGRDSLIKALLAPRPKIKPYGQVVTKDFTSMWGLFAVHVKKDQVYFEIADSLLGRDIMVINRLEQGPAGSAFAGEELSERTIQFERGPDSTIRIRFDLVINEADSGDAIHRAVVRSSLNPVAASFPVIAYGKDGKSAVIDVSKFLKEKNFINAIAANSSLGKDVNTASMKDFNLEYIHVYPINVELSISKNLDPKTPAGDPATIVTHTSFIALPRVPLQRRFFDPRVGYFNDEYYAFGDQQQHAELKKFILRWRLEPRDEDVERWKRGELVEPKQPIVIYVDPATPMQWRSYLVQGINDWQAAFEHAGFKHAIIGKEWPTDDTTMHMDDARYSMLCYFPSMVANAYGPNIHDPRSGEIIQTHIGWYHNVMSLLYKWYFIQTAAVDPRARKARFEDALMGELIRFVSSHEVGHTLGLRHNFGASSQTPVDSLRSRHWLDIHGHTSSIMDYARFNYVAQPEDNIPEADLFPRIGEYDKWAIGWGYKSSFSVNAEADKKIVRQWIVDSVGRNSRLWWEEGELKKVDARTLTEDLGDDPVKASVYGIRNLRRILPHIPEWGHEEGGLNENLSDLYKALTDQYQRYLGHVLKSVGGVYFNLRSEEEQGALWSPVPKARQLACLGFFDEQLFTTPYWLLDSNVTSRLLVNETPNVVEDLQVKMINSLIDLERINNLLSAEKNFGKKGLSAAEYIATLHRMIWRELRAGGAVVVDGYRRNLQKSYLGAEIDILSSKGGEDMETDASSLIKADIYQLREQLKAAIPRATDVMTIIHLRDLDRRISDLMERSKQAN